MEVACGEYGDVVPQLVVAVKNNKCKSIQSVSESKVINPEKAVRDKNCIDVFLQDRLLIDEKTVDYDPNLESNHETKQLKVLEGYAESEGNDDENDSLKNEKLCNEQSNYVCMKQVFIYETGSAYF